VSESAELGVLLRGWRERVTPGDVGLAVDPGRRVPGLRRQEVAKLAGVSPDYLVQLEQGRATAPSAQVLLAMARTLRLSNFERDHLLRLAGYGPPVEHDAAPSADLKRLVRQLGVVPAAMYDVCWNPITWNRLWASVNGDPLGRPIRERNMMWRFMVGLPTRVRRSAADVHDVQRALVGDLRATLGQHGHDDRCSEFVAGLSAHSHNFRDLWNMQHVDAYRHDTKVIDQPQVGTLHVDCDVLVGSDGQRLVMYTALPRSVTADRLQQLFEASEDPKAPSELSA
jgi:transcriptional regulator with XRE-family HTH domain